MLLDQVSALGLSWPALKWPGAQLATDPPVPFGSDDVITVVAEWKAIKFRPLSEVVKPTRKWRTTNGSAVVVRQRIVFSPGRGGRGVVLSILLELVAERCNVFGVCAAVRRLHDG
uniref:Uncharacterized protein n=1 Tax=Globodera rostochiensis TaxID=31243 RepID=A0A914HNY5_GLORO